MNRARTQAILTAREKLALHPVYLDTETTGLVRDSEIVEVCLIDENGEVLFESLVRPTRPVPPDAMRIHGITNEMLKSKPTWLVTWPRIEQLIAGRTVGIYNAEFDLRMMQQTHSRYRMPWPPAVTFDHFCIMKLYAQYFGDWNPARSSYRWHSLESAGRQCRIPLLNSHRAIDDTLLARAVLQHIASDSSLT
jgi:DNA polymerase-3 subunit epsilon